MSKSEPGKYNYRRPAKGRNNPNRPGRHITVRSVRRSTPDLRKLGRALIAKALADAEAEKAEVTQENSNEQTAVTDVSPTRDTSLDSPEDRP